MVRILICKTDNYASLIFPYIVSWFLIMLFIFVMLILQLARYTMKFRPSLSNAFLLLNNLDNPTEQDVIDLYHKLLWSTQVTTTTKQYTLVSLIKLSTRLRSGQEYVSDRC